MIKKSSLFDRQKAERESSYYISRDELNVKDDSALKMLIGQLEKIRVEKVVEFNILERKLSKLETDISTIKSNINYSRLITRDRDCAKRENDFRELMYKKHGEGFIKEQLDKIYAKAYERGHSSGFDEIEIYFIDYLDLLR
jgi:hypothetical protein